MSLMFSGCTSLTTIEGLDYKSISSETKSRLTGGLSNTSIRKMYIKNIGYSVCPAYDFSAIKNWGVKNTSIPDASLSIYKSLVEDTSNRIEAGSTTPITIKISNDSSIVLTQTNIGRITERGYTVSVVNN